MIGLNSRDGLADWSSLFGGLGCDQVAAPKSCQFSPAYSCSMDKPPSPRRRTPTHGKHTPRASPGSVSKSSRKLHGHPSRTHEAIQLVSEQLGLAEIFFFFAIFDSFTAQQYVAGVRSVGVAEEQGTRLGGCHEPRANVTLSCRRAGADNAMIVARRSTAARVFKDMCSSARGQSAPSTCTVSASAAQSFEVVQVCELLGGRRASCPLRLDRLGRAVISEGTRFNECGKATSPARSCALRPSSKPSFATKYEGDVPGQAAVPAWKSFAHCDGVFS